MKVSERLVKDRIPSSISSFADPLPFTYCPNRSMDDAISHVLHSTLSHVDKKHGNCVRLLFINYSSAFNTIVPHRLFTKLRELGLKDRPCAWVLNFFTGRPQMVRVGGCISNSIILNTGAPQGCVLGPLLHTLYTHDCVSAHSSNSIVKFADDTTVMGFISSNNKTAYREEMENLTLWC